MTTVEVVSSKLVAMVLYDCLSGKGGLSDKASSSGHQVDCRLLVCDSDMIIIVAREDSTLTRSSSRFEQKDSICCCCLPRG